MSNLLLGSHVSLSGKEMLLGSAEEAASYGANIFMVYTGAPQNTRRKPVEQFKVEEAHDFMASHDMPLFTVHAPYIVNLANTTKPDYHSFAVEFLKEELRRVKSIGAHLLTLHPGAHVGAGEEKGMKQLIMGLNDVLDSNTKVTIALETMAGKGTEIGKTFEELAEIISGVTHNEHLAVTFDTCHVYDAGYDIRNQLDEVLETFDQIIGLDRIKVMHINDSKFGLGSHKDRHANIGIGEIGFDALYEIVNLPEFKDIPKILETPWVPIEEDSKKTLPPYKYEIAMLKEGQYNPQLMEDILEQY